MKKKILSLLLSAVLMLSAAPAARAAPSLSNFYAGRTYSAGVFRDVPEGAWYAEHVAAAYAYGFFDGRAGEAFAPGGALTLAEAVKLSVLLHSGYYDGEIAPGPSGAPWYAPYVAYALENGLLDREPRYPGAVATRADFARLLAAALPEEALAAKNRVDDGAIPDVSMTYAYAAAVYRLYRAGVLTGSDRLGTFRPNAALTRGEAAAVMVRMVSAEHRMGQSLRKTLTAEEVAQRCAPAVFYIEVFDRNDELVRTGSGFFIGEDGVAVTNHHVIWGASRAVVTLADGRQHNVQGVYDMNGDADIALLKIAGTGFAHLEPAEPDTLRTGSRIYTLGSPLGLQNTFSEGIVSTVRRVVDGMEFIQIDAPISPGSSGGALLNAQGRVVGVTTAAFTEGQNMNLCVPIEKLSLLSRGRPAPLPSLIPAVAYYPGGYPRVDFGALLGVPARETVTTAEGETYYYDRAALEDAGEAVRQYIRMLECNFFSLYLAYEMSGGETAQIYLNSAYNTMIVIRETEYDGVPVIGITVS